MLPALDAYNFGLRKAKNAETKTVKYHFDGSTFLFGVTCVYFVKTATI